MDETRGAVPPGDAVGNDDLLRSTLTESDDAIDFDRPWSPATLVWVAFFGGLPAGGALYALNFRRLGMPSAAAPTFACAMVLTLVGHGFAMSRIAAGQIDAETTRLYKYGLKALAVLFSLVVTALQRRRFRLFEMTGKPKGALLKPAVISALASAIFVFLYGMLIMMLVRRPG